MGEVGEVLLSGPMVIRGYWNRPEATAEAIVDGWLHTGDLGYLDDEGFLFLVDRAKDMVLRGGENVYCAEVEAAIYEHPGVHEAAVFGLPHERLGEEVVAAIQPRPGATIDLEQMAAFLEERIARFMVPTRWFIRDEPLPAAPPARSSSARDPRSGPRHHRLTVVAVADESSRRHRSEPLHSAVAAPSSRRPTSPIAATSISVAVHPRDTTYCASLTQSGRHLSGPERRALGKR